MVHLQKGHLFPERTSPLNVECGAIAEAAVHLADESGIDWKFRALDTEGCHLIRLLPG